MTLAAFGCRKATPIPTEKLLVAKNPAAPGLSELQPHMTSNHTIYWGEVFRPHATFPDFEWEGTCEGEVLKRKGAIQIGQTPLEGGVYAFTSDFLEAGVPTASWLCMKMGSPAAMGQPCENVLRRIVASSGKLVAYVNCLDATCPMAELSDGKLTTIQVPTPLKVRVVKFGQTPTVLLWSHWGKGPDWTGASLSVFALQPPLQKLAEIALQEIDARDPVQVLNRLGTAEIVEDGVRVQGKKVMVERETAKELSSAEFDEKYVITSTGVVRK